MPKRMPDYEVLPHKDSVRTALRRIQALFGDEASVFDADEDLVMDGYNPDVDSAAWRTYWGGPTDHEAYVAANDITEVVSDNVGDTGQVRIKGHTVSGTGASAVFTEVTQDATMNGTTPVALATPLARVNSLRNIGQADFVGTITVQETGGTVHLRSAPITGLHPNAGHKCAATVKGGYYWLITDIVPHAVKAGLLGDTFKAYLQVREPGGVFVTETTLGLHQLTSVSGFRLDSPIIVKPNSDVRVVGISSGSNAFLGARVEGPLAKVVV